VSADSPVQLRRPPGPTIVAVLALLQAAFEAVLAVTWLRYGTQLEGKGLLLLPILSLLFVLRGVIAAVLAALYVLFAWGARAIRLGVVARDMPRHADHARHRRAPRGRRTAAARGRPGGHSARPPGLSPVTVGPRRAHVLLPG
jgi:hypothetical protein